MSKIVIVMGGGDIEAVYADEQAAVEIINHDELEASGVGKSKAEVIEENATRNLNRIY